MIQLSATKIDNLLDKIIENLALIFYNIEHNDKHYVKHWLTELTAHIDALRERKLKLSKERIFHDVIDAIDLTSPSQIKRRIRNKFLKEGFNMDDLSYDAYTNIMYFINNYLSPICCGKYYSNSKFEETRDDIVDKLEEFLPNIEEFI